MSALQGGHVNSSIELIKALDKTSAEVKKENLKALVTIVATCYEALSKTLDLTFGIVSTWLEDYGELVADEPKYPSFLAVTMSAQDKKDWFQPNNKGEYEKI